MFKKFRRNISIQILTGLVLAFAVLCAIISSIGYVLFTRAIAHQYESKAYYTARTAAHEIDINIFDKAADLEETKMRYQLLKKEWQNLVDTQDATFIYLYKKPRDNFQYVQVLLSVMNSSLDYNVFSSGMIVKLPEDDIPSYREIFEKGKDRAAMHVFREEYGSDEFKSGDHVTVLIPIYDSHNRLEAVLGVERKMRELQNVRREYLRHTIFTTLLFLALIIAIYSRYIHDRLLSPIEKIAYETTRFAHENKKSEHELSENIKSIDEIGQLARTIDKMEDDVVNYINNLTRVTKEKEQIKAELNIAKDIQAGILPKIFPDRSEFEIYATMTPAKEVGGDLYDVFMIDDNHLALIIADVSGKGVPAALFMMTAKALIKNRAQFGGKPSEILGDVNNQLCEGNEGELFVTVWLGILEISTGKIICANAGHEYPAVKNSSGRYELFKTKNSPAVAAMEDMRFRDNEFTLSPGDILYTYTDGVAEATNINNELFGTDRMIECLNGIYDKNPDAPAQDILVEMKAKIDEFTGEAPQFDDITMLCVKYFGNKN